MTAWIPGAANGRQALLRVERLTTAFTPRAGPILAVNDVSFSLGRGEALGLVGESGCGKSTLGLSLVRLIPSAAGRIVAGRILFDGLDLLELPTDQMRRLRGERIAMIFQNPMTSLNPTYTIGAQIVEALQAGEVRQADPWGRAISLLDLVGMPGSRDRARSYPHELSGGMRQRAMTAMALSRSPDLVTADEPTTALDVTIQAQILWLLDDLRRRSGSAMIFITHNLVVASNFCDRIAVMYAGRIVETASAQEIVERPLHPYTRALVAALPTGHWSERSISSIPGSPPPLHAGQPGCLFAPRCPNRSERCENDSPQLELIAEGHEAACWWVKGR